MRRDAGLFLSAIGDTVTNPLDIGGEVRASTRKAAPVVSMCHMHETTE
jgi:hypothetical protein